MRDQIWANTVRSGRKAKQLTRRELARRAGIDPSYVTLIERHGYVPRRDKVEELGRVLGDQDQAMVMAGFVPGNRRRDVLGVVRNAAVESLSPQMQAVVNRLKALPPRFQVQAIEILDALCKTAESSKRRPA